MKKPAEILSELMFDSGKVFYPVYDEYSTKDDASRLLDKIKSDFQIDRVYHDATNSIQDHALLVSGDCVYQIRGSGLTLMIPSIDTSIFLSGKCKEHPRKFNRTRIKNIVKAIENIVASTIDDTEQSENFPTNMTHENFAALCFAAFPNAMQVDVGSRDPHCVEIYFKKSPLLSGSGPKKGVSQYAQINAKNFLKSNKKVDQLVRKYIPARDILYYSGANVKRTHLVIEREVIQFSEMTPVEIFKCLKTSPISVEEFSDMFLTNENGA